MNKSTRFIVEPDIQGDGVLAFTEHRTKKDAMKRMRYWLHRRIKAELYSTKNEAVRIVY